tara:strand:- start:1433 stop:2161 length:729 start_codon:yes stop_codon:yes gene_type:complete
MDDYTGDNSYEETPSSEYSVEEDQDTSFASDDIDDEPEIGDDGEPQAIPYKRFKKSREQLRALKAERDELMQQFSELRGRQASMEEYIQHMQRSAGSRDQERESEEEQYADPLEGKVAKLEKIIRALHHRQESNSRQSQVKDAERQIRSELERARSKYPDMSDLFVLDALARNPNARVIDLAKTSHNKTHKRFEEWASKRGYKPRARRLAPAGRKGSTKPVDIGDSLDLAEEAAIEYLLSIE